MKHFRTSGLILLFLLLAAAVLGGCHGSKALPAFEAPASFNEEKQYELNFWAKNDTNITQTAVYQKAISDFEALYPNIRIKIHLYNDYGKIYNDVITNIATQTTPNICITYPDHIATYLSGVNVVAPLSGLMSDPAYGLGGTELRFDGPTEEEIVPEFLQEGVIGGTQYALPYMRSTEACYVNVTLLQKLGYQLPEVLTWDFVFEVSEAAMAKNSDGTYRINGQNVMIPFIYKSTDNMMIQQLRQLNAAYSSETGEIGIFNDTTKDLLFQVAEHGASGAFSTFKISSYPGNFLNAGQCIFAVDSTAGATWMGSGAPNMDIADEKVAEFETAVLPVPQFDPENPKMISQGPSVCIFNKKDPDEVLASWLFVQYLLTNEVQLGYAETEGYIPVTIKARESEEYQEYLKLCGADEALHYEVKIRASQLLLANTENTFTTAVFRGSASLRDAAGQLIENTVKAARRGETVDDAYFDQLFDSVRALYRLDQLGNDASAGRTREDLGPLPAEAKGLLIGLTVLWAGIIGYVVLKNRKRRKGDKRS